MKTLPSIIAASLLLASVSATAGYFERTDTGVLTTSAVATESAAFQLGVNKLTQLQGASGRQLDLELSGVSHTAKLDTLHLKDGGYVTIQKRVNADGSVSYVGLVNVGFGYTDFDD